MEYRLKDFGIYEDLNMCTALIKLQLSDSDQKEDFENDLRKLYGDIKVRHDGEQTELFFNTDHYHHALDFYQRLYRLNHLAKPFGVIL